MNIQSLLADNLLGSVGFLKMTVADMSDDDLRQRPVDGANTPLWQIGHLVVALTSMLTFAKAPLPELPPAFAAYRDRTNTAGGTLSKDEVVNTLASYTALTADWTRTLTDEQLATPSPENMRQMAPTLAHMLALLPNHNAMHVGQIQVLRRKLGKPILF